MNWKEGNHLRNTAGKFRPNAHPEPSFSLLAAPETVVTLPKMGSKLTACWASILEMSAWPVDSWSLVGGQMVLLHGLSNGIPPPRLSEDVDAVVDVRAMPPRLKVLARMLADHGYEPHVSPDSVAHRWEREGVKVDLMATEGTGSRTDLRTVGSFKTIAVEGSSQAVRRSSKVLTRLPERDLEGRVPLPSLVGAIVLKSCAAVVDIRDKSRHYADIAFMCSLIGYEDLVQMKAGLGPKDRQRLRRVTVLDNHDHAAWKLIGGRAEQGKANRDFLCS